MKGREFEQLERENVEWGGMRYVSLSSPLVIDERGSCSMVSESLVWNDTSSGNAGGVSCGRG